MTASILPPLSVWPCGPPWRVGKHKGAQTAIAPSRSPSRSLERGRQKKGGEEGEEKWKTREESWIGEDIPTPMRVGDMSLAANLVVDQRFKVEYPLTLCYAHAVPRQPEQLPDYTLMYAHIGRLAICLSSAMLRAKIDLRQPSFLLRPRTVTSTFQVKV